MDKAARPARRFGCGTMALGFFGVLGVVMFIISDTGGTKDPAADDPKNFDTPQLASSCDARWASTQVRRAQAQGIVRGQFIDGADIIVVVNPLLWSQLPLTAGNAIGLALACELQPDAFALPIRFRYQPQGEDVLRLGPGELFALRNGDSLQPLPAKPRMDFGG